MSHKFCYMRSNSAQEKGMVTAETGISLFVFATAFITVLLVISASFAYLQTQDVARYVARSLSLGTSPAEVVEDVAERNPHIELVFTCEDAQTIKVSAKNTKHMLTERFGVSISAHSTAHMEPGARCEK